MMGISFPHPGAARPAHPASHAGERVSRKHAVQSLGYVSADFRTCSQPLHLNANPTGSATLCRLMMNHRHWAKRINTAGVGAALCLLATLAPTRALARW